MAAKVGRAMHGPAMDRCARLEERQEGSWSPSDLVIALSGLSPDPGRAPGATIRVGLSAIPVHVLISTITTTRSWQTSLTRPSVPK